MNELKHAVTSVEQLCLCKKGLPIWLEILNKKIEKNQKYLKIFLVNAQF